MNAPGLGAVHRIRRALSQPLPYLRHLRAYNQFRLASVVIVVFAMAVVGPWVESQITNRVIDRTAQRMALYTQSRFGEALQELEHADSLSPEKIEALNSLMRGSALGKTLAALKIRDRGGRILYSSAAPSMVGRSFPDDPKMMRAWKGEVAAGISTLDDPENAGERHLAPQLLEVYLPIYGNGSERIITVAEFFVRIEDLQSEISKARAWTWSAFAASVLIVYLVMAGLFRRADRTIQKQADELEAKVTSLAEVLTLNAELDKRVRHAAAAMTTLNERILKRVGAELHDGPAQDQSFVLMRLDNVLARAERCVHIHDEGKICLEEVTILRSTMEQSMSELRAISSGLGLARLGEMTFPTALRRAVRAHQQRTGTTVKLELDGIPDEIPLPAKITLYRVVQEALNNAFHHAGGIGQEVRARRENDDVVLEVADRGPGFDTTAVHDLLPGQNDYLGLHGMRDRIESLGGTFSLESKPGEGTTVRVRLSVRAGRTAYA